MAINWKTERDSPLFDRRHCHLTIIGVLTVLCSGASTVTVRTNYGKLRGLLREVDGKNITSFLGVPYARPPIKDLRFRAPETLVPWGDNSTWDATKMTPACLQNPTIFRNVFAPHLDNQETSEDCLYLNLYVPGEVKANRSDPLAVMVWLHGGTFQTGTGSVQNGARLAQAGNVIVVTLNYRLGIFGFFSTQDGEATGNWGLRDQVVALQWVADEIETFGGDSSRVTIFGESSGAFSVGLHVLSPLSRGLFIRAISESGNQIMYGLNHYPSQRVDKIVSIFACSNNTHMPSSKHVVRCLQKVNAEKLIQADLLIPTAISPFSPRVDGVFLTDQPEKLILMGNISAVEYIVGFNNDEESTLCYTIPLLFHGSGFNRTVFQALLSETPMHRYRSPTPTKMKGVVQAALLSHYLPAEETEELFRREYLNARRDIIASQTIRYASYHSKRAKCFVYYFTHRPSTSRLPQFIGAGNSDEIQFVFGDIKENGTADEKDLSDQWMNAWASFAKNGYPEFTPKSIPWMPYNKTFQEYLEIKVNMTSDNLKTRLLERNTILWNNVLPGIIDLKGNGHNEMVPMTTARHDRKPCPVKDWGMKENQIEELLLSLIIVVLFLAVVCVTLVRIMCQSPDKVPGERKHANMNNVFVNRSLDTDNTGTHIKSDDSGREIEGLTSL